MKTTIEIKLSDVKDALSQYECSYKKTAKKNDYASWNNFCKGLLNAAEECDGTMDDIIFQGEDALKKINCL